MHAAVRQIAAIVRKDILLELRTRESITAMVVFAVMAIVMFNFALRLRVDTFRPLTPGVLWVTLVFAGTLGLSRSMSSEQINQCMDGLLLAPCDRSVIFAGKAITNVIFTLAVALVVTPIMAILFDETLLQPGVWLVVVLGVVGYAGTGTLIATMAASTRAREVFLPILLFPLALPLLVAAVIATSGFLDRLPLDEFAAWIGVELAFIVIFWTAGTLLFEYLVEG
ncbi:MAG: heme exporter protein CcmB [Anaerolineae bacterium]|nr:heme exporter protein CcmB [Candidatus Roseilinea sp.]MDW8451301.1 heme exporter protein CcmB [Anaerolineae bacterium]